MPIKPEGSSLSFSEIQAEFGGTNPISLSEYYRNGSFVTSNNGNVPQNGQIRIQNFYNTVKAFVFDKIISSNVNNYNLKSDAIANGWNQVDPLLATVTINSGVTVSSTSVGTAAFDTGVTFSQGSTISVINNGAIRGRGGNGGAGGTNSGNGATGGTGGIGLRVQAAISLTNNGTIAGGSGGQGGGAANRTGGTNGDLSSSCGQGPIQCAATRNCTRGFCNTVVGPTGSIGTQTGSTGPTGVAGVTRTYGTNNLCDPACDNNGCQGAVTCATGSPGAGGAPGAAINGNGNITYNATGTRLGPIT